MKIAIDLNGVVRDVFSKAEQVYQKFYIDDFLDDESSTYDEEKGWVESESDTFKYELSLPVTSMNLIDHFKFERNEDLYNFFYVDFPMQIFGHSSTNHFNDFNVLNDLYVDLREEHDVYIISDEMGKSKPATLFFLSKYGCLYENIKFYSKITIDKINDEFDLIVTANPDLLDREDDKVIKYKTTYNQNFKKKYEVNEINELNELINNLINK